MNGRWNIRTVAVGLSLALLLYIAYLVRTALLLIFVSVIFSVIFAPLVRKIRRIRVWRWSPGQGAAILILFGVVLSALGIFVAFAIPPVAHDAQELTRDLAQNVRSAQEKIRHIPFGNAIAGRLNENGIRQSIHSGVQKAFSFLQGIMGG